MVQRWFDVLAVSLGTSAVIRKLQYTCCCGSWQLQSASTTLVEDTVCAIACNQPRCKNFLFKVHHPSNACRCQSCFKHQHYQVDCLLLRHLSHNHRISHVQEHIITRHADSNRSELLILRIWPESEFQASLSQLFTACSSLRLILCNSASPQSQPKISASHGSSHSPRCHSSLSPKHSPEDSQHPNQACSDLPGNPDIVMRWHKLLGGSCHKALLLKALPTGRPLQSHLSLPSKPLELQLSLRCQQQSPSPWEHKESQALHLSFPHRRSVKTQRLSSPHALDNKEQSQQGVCDTGALWPRPNRAAAVEQPQQQSHSMPPHWTPNLLWQLFDAGQLQVRDLTLNV